MTKLEETQGVDLVGLVARAERKLEVVDPVAAFGPDGRTPTLLVTHSQGGQSATDLLDAAKAREAWREHLAVHPYARRGTAVLTALASFIAWVLRFKKPETVIFAGPEALTAVVDYHGPEAGGNPGHQRHKAAYQFPFSAEWKFWSKLAGKVFTQSELAELIENHIQDIVAPTGGELEELLGVELAGPSTMLTVARGIEVRASMKVAQAVSLASGETRVAFDETHQTAAKDGSALTVPGGFMVSIPIYEGGVRWKLAVRLRYRVANGAVVWLLAVHQADAALRESYDEVVLQVEKETGVIVLRGEPERG